MAERSSMLYAGTPVVAGDGTAVVTATGSRSELGALGRLVADAKEPPTPLQRALSQLAKTILVSAIAASVVVPIVGVVAGQPVRDMLLAGLTIAFATIPEELPILVVVLLAVGGRQLARRGALLRRLRAGETLGNVTVVVTDKTGTLTENRLTLARTPLTGPPRDAAAWRSTNRPDAGPSSTMWATGRKTVDERISQGPSTALNVPGQNFTTVPEKAQTRGMKVGDVSTAEITDATPAVLSSHISLRGCQGPADMAACPTETKAAGGLGSIAEQQSSCGTPTGWPPAASRSCSSRWSAASC